LGESPPPPLKGIFFFLGGGRFGKKKIFFFFFWGFFKVQKKKQARKLKSSFPSQPGNGCFSFRAKTLRTQLKNQTIGLLSGFETLGLVSLG